MNLRAKNAIVFFVALLSVGTLGYRTIEGWGLLDSLYMTVITMSTVGYGELQPLSPAGKVFTSFLILVGVGSLAYLATRTTEALMESRVLHHRRTLREIRRMNQHVIVCGYGRMGTTLSELLRAQGAEIVVIDKDPRLDERLREAGIRHLAGDATDDAVLLRAGVQQARALATVLPHDADNLFVTLTARRQNPKLTIITRSCFVKNDSKMIAAGATRVLNPYQHGGRLMAQQVLQPTVTEFIDVLSDRGAGDLKMEEVQLEPSSTLAGVKLRDAPLRKEMNVIVVAVRDAAGRFHFNPPPDMAPRVGDILIALGSSASMRELAELAGGGKPL